MHSGATSIQPIRQCVDIDLRGNTQHRIWVAEFGETRGAVDADISWPKSGPGMVCLMSNEARELVSRVQPINGC